MLLRGVSGAAVDDCTMFDTCTFLVPTRPWYVAQHSPGGWNWMMEGNIPRPEMKIVSPPSLCNPSNMEQASKLILV